MFLLGLKKDISWYITIERVNQAHMASEENTSKWNQMSTL